MTGEIHEVQGNEHNSRDSEQSHMEVRESLYMHEIELLDDSHRKKIECVKEIILAMIRGPRYSKTPYYNEMLSLQFFELYVLIQWLGFLVLNNS